MTNGKQILFLVPLIAVTVVNAPICFGTPAIAGTKAPTTGRVPVAVDPDAKALSAMEQSYFQHTFPADPPEKRLQRLELFLTNETQDGSVSDRVAMLKNVIARKHRTESKVASGVGSTASSNSDLNKLEQLILKKKFPHLDQSTRLAALEKKVFGAPFPAIPASERINRLKKTLGVGESDVAEVPPGFKTYRFNQEFGSANPFGMPFAAPYGSSIDPDINRQMSDMFNQLNQQLRQLHRMPPGGGFGYPNGQTPRRFIDPDGQADPDSEPEPAVPQPNNKNAPPRLPPYMDPNSI
jgi:hypothetical protein